MKDKNAIPDGVTDIDAWNESKKLERHPIFKTQFYTTSEDVVLNIGMMIHNLRDKIKHLPRQEQDKILKLKQIYLNVNNNLTVQKRKAFGLRQGQGNKHPDSEGILERRREDLLELFGRMFETEEILKIVNTEWGMVIGKKLLLKFKYKYAEEIKKRVDNYQISFHNVRLGIKKSRLEELSELYRSAKALYVANPKREDLRILIQLLEQLRKEAEGDRLTIDGKVDISYEQNIQAHLQKEVFATVNLKEIILGRVAARMNINPVKLIFSLQNSYYKQFSNVLGDFDENASGDLPYPSQLNYDFERIGKNFIKRDMEIEDAVIVEETENDKDIDQGLKLKEKLAAKLRSKTKNIEDFKTKLDILTEEHKKKK